MRRREHIAIPRPERWRALVRFPEPRTWLLVVPGGGTGGYTIPPLIVRELRVSVG